jgi:benzil reductase ((S)-benzoin forming)
MAPTHRFLAVVTGHSRGLGEALAADLLDRGAAVVGVSRTSSATLAGRSGLTEVALDLADTDAVRTWLAGPFTALGWEGTARAVLVNNAGLVEPVGPIGSLDHAALVRAVAVNLTAPLLLTDAFVAATTDVPDRRVVQISSGAGSRAYGGWGAYCAAKAGLDHFTRAAGHDDTPGLRVVAVAPGVVDTAMQAEIRAIDPGRFPLRERFVGLHRDGALTDAAVAARQVLDLALAGRVTSGSVLDVRT